MEQPGDILPDDRGIGPDDSIVRVIAVAGVIFGVIGMSCLPFSWCEPFGASWPLEPHGMPNPVFWQLWSSVVGLGLAALLTLSSLGAYHFKWWGWYGMMFWAAASLAWSLGGAIFWFQYFLPWRRENYVMTRGPDELAPLIGTIIAIGLSIFVLRFFPRRPIRALFQLTSREIDAAPAVH